MRLGTVVPILLCNLALGCGALVGKTADSLQGQSGQNGPGGPASNSSSAPVGGAGSSNVTIRVALTLASALPAVGSPGTELEFAL